MGLVGAAWPKLLLKSLNWFCPVIPQKDLQKCEFLGFADEECQDFGVELGILPPKEPNKKEEGNQWFS